MTNLHVSQRSPALSLLSSIPSRPSFPHLPHHISLTLSHALIKGRQLPTTVMPESSQPRRQSHLNHMVRANSSDGPNSDNMPQPQYYENRQTTRVPTKSGTNVPTRPHSHSDSPPPTSRPSSRLSSRGDELDHDAFDMIQKNSAMPSTEEFSITARTIQREPLIELGAEHGFTFGKAKASQNNTPGELQSTSSSQSSHAVSHPSSFETSNQEHQVSARSAQEEISLAPTSQGLSRVFSWLSSWLTLNLEAPVDCQKAVQLIGSPPFQNIPVAEESKASSIHNARQSVLQRAGHSHMQDPKQPKCKRQAFSGVDYLYLLILITVLALVTSP